MSLSLTSSMEHKCDGCGKQFGERKYLLRHENKCSRLKEQRDRRWKAMRIAERDPVERKRRRDLQERSSTNPRNPFDPLNTTGRRKKAKISLSTEGPSGTRRSVSLTIPLRVCHWLTLFLRKTPLTFCQILALNPSPFQLLLSMPM